MIKIITIIVALFFSLGASAQKERKFIRKGNDYFEQGLKDTAKLDTVAFGNAEVAYRKALQIKPQDFHWNFNLADAIYKQKKAEEAAAQFEKLAEQTQKPVEKAAVYHNLGNSLLQQKKFDPSIDAYKKALRLNPNDPETKYNLAFAMKMKQEDQKQKQNQDKKDQDKNKDKNKDQNKDQNQDKDQNKDQNRDQNKNNQNQDKKPQDQQNQPQQGKISRQNAEQMLQALENDEKQTQEKVKKAQAVQAKSGVEKNW